MTRHRHELKTTISVPQYHILRSRFKAVLRTDPHANAHGEYFIRSLYFDDFANTALAEKQSGLLQRKKYRLRYYNLDPGFVRLECKEKWGQYIRKTGTTISGDEAQTLSRGNPLSLDANAHPLRNRLVLAMKIRRLRPVVIVDYTREAYTYPAGNVRLTFDTGLATGLRNTELFNVDLVTIPAIDPGHVILEIKYDAFLPSHIRNLLPSDLHPRTAISKYVLCRKYNKANDWEDQ